MRSDKEVEKRCQKINPTDDQTEEEKLKNEPGNAGNDDQNLAADMQETASAGIFDADVEEQL